MNSSSISDEVTDFLLFGVDKKRAKDNPLENLNSEIVRFLKDWNNGKSTQIHHLEKLKTLAKQTGVFSNNHNSSNIIEMLKLQKRKQAKIHYLNLHKAIVSLQNFSKVQDIPNMLHRLCLETPRIVFGQSKIKIMLLQTVKSLKSQLLMRFHALFEEHLTNTHKNMIIEKENDNTWTSFLGNARDWLLAYSLVSLLPVVLAAAETDTQVSNMYCEALDQAFTPIWGRFYSHLQVAQAARNVSHLVWSFAYSRSFVHMLADLCVQMTSSGQLQQLCAMDYRRIGLQHVRDKSVKFLRAHFAQLLHDLLPLNEALCAQLAEECLEMDCVLLGLEAESSSRDNSLSAVLFDCKEAFHQWLLLERDFFLTALQNTCTCSTEAFAFDFSGVGDQHQRCYRVTHKALSLLLLTIERYQHLSDSAQLLLSEIVVEPLICSVVGLFLMRIRSHPELYALSCGDFRRSSVISNGGEELPPCLADFKASARYVDDVLNRMAAKARQKGFRSNHQRMKVRWRAVQTAVPKRLLDATERCDLSRTETQAARLGSFSLQDMLLSAFQLPESYTQASNAKFSYRATIPTQLTSGDDLELHECMDAGAGLILTLETVMQRQFNKS